MVALLTVIFSNVRLSEERPLKQSEKCDKVADMEGCTYGGTLKNILCILSTD